MALPCLGWVFTFEPNLDRPSQVWLETSLLGDSQSALAMMVPIKHVLGQAGENQIPPLCSVLFCELFPKPFSSYDSNEHCRMRQHAENPDLPLFFQSSSFLTVCLLTWRLFKLCLPQTRGQSVSVSMWPSEARQSASLVLCESPFVRESLLSVGGYPRLSQAWRCDEDGCPTALELSVCGMDSQVPFCFFKWK